MSVGNLKTEGQKGNNLPWQRKMLNVLNQVATSSGLSATEATLQLVLAAIQESQDYETKLIQDVNEDTFLEVRIWNPDTQTWEAPKYYKAGSNTAYSIGDPGGPVAPIVYVNPLTLLAQIEAITAQMSFTGNDLNVSANMQVGDVDVSGANPVPVTGTLTAAVSLSGNADYFNQLITVSPFNQVELRGDKADYLDYLTQSATGGASLSQTSGVLRLASGTNPAGSVTAITVDAVEYRPANEIYAAGTAVFSPGVADNTRRIGITDNLSFTNSVTFGYEGTTFSLRYTRGGVQVFSLAQASWDDPCDGSIGSLYTKGGVPVAIDFQTGNIYRVRAGLFGYAGWIAEVFSPDRQWVKIYEYVNVNDVNTPVFTNNDFKIVLYNVNSGSTLISTLDTQCWAAGTSSKVEKISAPLSDRTLAETVRSVITGKSSSGGGTYVNVKVNPSGSLEVNSSQGTTPWIVETNTTVRTPGLIRATGPGNIPAGARSISVYNAGSVAGSILGVVGNVLPGEIMNFAAGGENDTLSIFAYDGTGTTLVITTIV